MRREGPPPVPSSPGLSARPTGRDPPPCLTYSIRSCNLLPKPAAAMQFPFHPAPFLLQLSPCLPTSCHYSSSILHMTCVRSEPPAFSPSYACSLFLLFLSSLLVCFAALHHFHLLPAPCSDSRMAMPLPPFCTIFRSTKRRNVCKTLTLSASFLFLHLHPCLEQSEKLTPNTWQRVGKIISYGGQKPA